MISGWKAPTWRVLLIASCAALAHCARIAPVTSPGVPPERKHSWELAFNRGDAESIAALYAPEGELVMAGTAPVHGRSAIRAAVTDLIRSGAKVEIGSDQNVGSGDLAYVYGRYRVTDASGHVSEQGRYLEIWQRRGGVWLITLDLNVAGPPPSGAPSGAAALPSPPSGS